MVVTYVLRGEDGSREKAAALKGFQEGDVVCEWQHIIAEDKIKTMRETFKAATLKYPNGIALSGGSGGGDDDDDDDW
ncbi:MAG: DUF2158 domain-containing protein [Saprospiraceae bacterium]|nr:DUF2158 domain-containing protein [Saprospiraceae bacterium]